jgi:hypothetical protein
MLPIHTGVPCTVIVTVDAQPAILAEMSAHADRGLELFAEFPGYLGGALHTSRDGGRLVQYLQWSSQAEYERCVADDSWDELPSTARFLSYVESGDAVVDARVFAVAAVRREASTPVD